MADRKKATQFVLVYRDIGKLNYNEGLSLQTEQDGLNPLLESLVKSYQKVYACQTLEECLEIVDEVQQKSFQRFVIVYDMDDISTEDCLRAFHRLAERRVAIIAVSSIEDLELMGLCIDAGVSQFVLKPVSEQVVKTFWIASNCHGRSNSSECESSSLPNISSLNKERKLLSLTRRSYSPIRGSVNFPSMEDVDHSNNLLSKLKSWDFDTRSISHDDLLRCCLLVFQDLELLSECNIDIGVFKRFLLIIKFNYHDNPYHNFYHACDVLQSTFYLMQKIEWRKFMEPIDALALMVAAYCHDVGHPGFNNMFLINAKSGFALLYNDKSVMENFHAMVVFAIIGDETCNFTANLTEADYKRFRGLVISSIIATDMGSHGNYVSAIESKLQSKSPMEAKSISDRVLLCNSLIKCSDISNVLRPFPISKRWAEELSYELRNQHQVEESMCMEHKMVASECIPQSQINFITDWALPLFRGVANLIPSTQFCLSMIDCNLEMWKQLNEKQGQPINDSRRMSVAGVENFQRLAAVPTVIFFNQGRRNSYA